MPRLPTITLALTLTAGLSACAGSPGPNAYQSDLDRLEADCQSRSGVLAPTGRSTGRPPLDYVCKLSEAPQR